MSKIETMNIPMPAHWASYLVNGDDSGMEGYEIEMCDRYLEQYTDEGWSVVSTTDEDGYFSWGWGDYGYLDGTRGGVVCDYVLQRWVEQMQVTDEATAEVRSRYTVEPRNEPTVNVRPSPMKSVMHVCGTCGSGDVYMNTTARWDVQSQVWALSDNPEGMIACEHCGEVDDHVVPVGQTWLAIRDIEGDGRWWTNDGWGDLSEALHFTENDRRLNLPIVGTWVQLGWED